MSKSLMPGTEEWDVHRCTQQISGCICDPVMGLLTSTCCELFSSLFIFCQPMWLKIQATDQTDGLVLAAVIHVDE